MMLGLKFKVSKTLYWALYCRYIKLFCVVALCQKVHTLTCMSGKESLNSLLIPKILINIGFNQWYETGAILIHEGSDVF